MQLPNICKFFLLVGLCMFIYLPSYFVYSQSNEEVKLLHTTITFVVCFVLCCLVAYIFVDKQQIPVVYKAPQSSKSQYINNLPTMTAQPKESIIPTKVCNTLEEYQTKERELMSQIQQKENALNLESDPQIQANLKLEIQHLESQLSNVQQAIKMKLDMVRKRVSTA